MYTMPSLVMNAVVAEPESQGRHMNAKPLLAFTSKGSEIAFSEKALLPFALLMLLP
ncbi:MAG: hypothetical protein H6R19_1911 [Proteobacteria bacterium]|nr:hypothetical protein [Pseudomonadota bacterium]